MNTCEYLSNNRYSSRKSESFNLVYPCRSGYQIIYSIYPWVQIWITHECTHAMPYLVVDWVVVKVDCSGIRSVAKS